MPKCGFPACEHHHDARKWARTAAFTVGKCFRQIDKNSGDGRPVSTNLVVKCHSLIKRCYLAKHNIWVLNSIKLHDSLYTNELFFSNPWTRPYPGDRIVETLNCRDNRAHFIHLTIKIQINAKISPSVKNDKLNWRLELELRFVLVT